MDISCKYCGKKQQKMKLCTRCKSVFYCSRECQITSWSMHKEICGKAENNSHHQADGCQSLTKKLSALETARPLSELHSDSYAQADYQFSTDCSVQPRRGFQLSWSGDKSVSVQKDVKHVSVKTKDYEPRIDFQKAADDVRRNRAKTYNSQNGATSHISQTLNDTMNTGQSNSKAHCRTYLSGNEVLTDLPELETSEPFVCITVKANKTKHKINIQNRWSSEEIFKIVSYTLHIPLNKLKLIHKGKVMTTDSVCDYIGEKSIFQAIGEKADDETGLISEEIELIMRQLKVERNMAVKALRETCDVVDAMLHISNK